MTDETLFQQLVVNEYARQMISDLQDVDWEEKDGVEVALGVNEDDVPRVIEELEELRDDGG